jgi:hypothetical protein
MNILYKNLLYTASGALVCLFLALPASAQRTNGGSGSSSSSSSSSSGSKSSGGGGGGSSSSSARPSGGGSSGGGASHSTFNSGGRSSGSVGISRPPSGSFQHTPGISGGQRSSGQVGYVNHQGTAVRGNYGYAPRPGTTASGNYGYAPRQNVGSYPARTAVAPNGSVQGSAQGVRGYRTAPVIGYGNGGYWGTHNYYHYAHGYYGAYYAPRLGFTCSVLPYGYYPFYWGNYQYYYSAGLYYQFADNEYTVVEPPIGAQISELPEKAQSIMINGAQYYELNGVYYMPYTKDDGSVVYEIVGKDGELNTQDAVQDQPQGPQMGDVVLQLPPDCRKIKVGGNKLWVSPDGVYYQEQVDASGNKSYKVVGLPSDEPEQN